ncbi:glycoside hydrolase family 31 protein [Anoxybacillus sp. J5B_2022]|uniref:glycoside hydrolase family 31 protein n=1 Tax=Anoxybacillus sp. J5B_2022 TaxID=3003246 RepID=UPI0022854A7D|nr:glycoside hydrolase family 31 protein [Anoxybacillus sp. J5B_2022]MCZ0755362.1 glycoside hydrolase family 31 protein [Anoxybacillus sp. J5B_2022]
MLEDTSFAILPEQNDGTNEGRLIDIGNMLAFLREKHVFSFSCDTGVVKIRFYREDVVRVVFHPFGETSLKTSVAVIKQPEKVEVAARETDEAVTLTSTKLTVVLQKRPFRVFVYDDAGRLLVAEGERGMAFTHRGHVYCYKRMDEADHFYGFGEKTGFLDKRGEKMTMWNTDVYAPHNPETDPLYQSHPYFMTVRNGYAHGLFFDNTHKTTFDFQTADDEYCFSAEGGAIDYYILAGPAPKDVLEQYTDLTGRMPIPPKWALGYHQSRYSYETEQEVRELMQTFREKDIPLDAIYLDIHYMDGYRVFTFDRNRFPNPKQLIHDLREEGVHVVPIVDPGVKADPEYHVYREGVRRDYFCKYMEGNIFFGEVWPGKSAFPDFMNKKVRRWWGGNHQFYTDLGIEGIWNDMNEPSVFNETKTMDVTVMHDYDGEWKTHRELHNVYGLMMGEATYKGMKKLLNGKRPFLLTRAGFSGIQRYAAVWTGDNRSFWEHLQMSLPMCMNLGLSGVAFCGPDVGGFAHHTNGELLTRWTQVGAFMPYFRNHCAIGFRRQEPWAFGETYERIIKKYIQMRYEWLPHLYTLFAEAHETGAPVMRPLVFEYPNDENTYHLSDEFLVGDNVLIAPIMTPKTMHRVVYLPKGKWVNYWTDEVLEGERHHLVHADLETLPIFVKQGSAIALGNVRRSTDSPDEQRFIHLYKADEGKAMYTLYDDDGQTFAYEKGQYFRMHLEMEYSEHTVQLVTKTEGTYEPSWTWSLAIHGATEQTKVMLNGNEQQGTWDRERSILWIKNE